MDVIQRIDNLMAERNWTDYRLSQKSGLSPSTIANMRHRNTVPSITTLETICKAFGITLSQFFNDNTQYVQLNNEQQQFFKTWLSLTDVQKQLIYDLIKEFK